MVMMASSLQTSTWWRRHRHRRRRHLPIVIVVTVVVLCCIRNIIFLFPANANVVAFVNTNTISANGLIDSSLPTLSSLSSTSTPVSSSSSTTVHQDHPNSLTNINNNNNINNTKNDVRPTTPQQVGFLDNKRDIRNTTMLYNNNINNNINNNNTHSRYNTGRPLPPFPWQWIHPMKTGTSFANALYMLSCPDEYDTINWTCPQELQDHSVVPLVGIQGASQECKAKNKKWTNGDVAFHYDPKKDWRRPRQVRSDIWWLGEHAFRSNNHNNNNNNNDKSTTTTTTTTTMLPNQQLFITMREPVDRMISQLTYQTRKLRVQQNAGTITEEEMVQFLLDKPKHLESPRLAHQMTALLFPYNTNGTGIEPFREIAAAAAAAANPQNETIIRKMKQQIGNVACQIVDEAAWIGFSDDYQRSICLLHNLFIITIENNNNDNINNNNINNINNIKRYDFPHHPAELINMRPSKAREKTTLNSTKVGELLRTKFDILDDIVYGCARQKFERDLKEYAPQCI